MRGNRSKRSAVKQCENQLLSEQNDRGGTVLSVSRKLFYLSSTSIILIIAISLLLFWLGLYRNLFYMTARYDFPAEIGGDVSAWTDFLRPGGYRISAGSWLAALGTLPFAVPILLTLLSVGTVYFFSHFLDCSRNRESDQAGESDLVKEKVAKEKQWKIVYAFIPVILLTVLIPVQGYYLFGCYRIGFFFSLLIGVFATAGMAWGTAQLTNGQKRLGIEVLSVFLGYLFFGSFALIAGLLMIRTELERSILKKSKSIRPILILLGIMVLTPLVWYPFFSGRIALLMIYTEGIFHQTAVRRDPITIYLTWGLALGAVLLMIAPTLVSGWNFFWRNFFLKSSGRKSKKKNNSFTADLRGNNQLAVLILILCVCSLFAYGVRDTHFRMTLPLVRLLDEGRWEEILEREASIGQPTFPMIELRRLALIETGRAGNEFFQRPNAGLVTEPLQKVTSYRIFGPELLLYSGNVSFAEHLSMNDFVDLHGRSPFYLKTLFLCAMAKKEYSLARRYYDHWNQMVQWWATKAMRRNVRMWGDFLTQTERDGIEPAAGNHQGTDEAAAFLEGVRIQIPAEEMTHYFHLARTIAVAEWQVPFADLPVHWMEVRLLRFLTSCDLTQFTEQFPIYVEQLKKEGRTIPAVFQQGWIYAEFFQTHHLPPVRFPCDREYVQQFANFLQLWERVPQRQPDGTFPPGSESILEQLKSATAGTWWYYAHCEMEKGGY